MREMKDSGIAWVGEIPKEWTIMPLYCFYSERKNKNIFGAENNLLSLSYGKVIRKDINTSEGLLPSNYNGYNIVEAGDIIIRPTDLQNDKRSLRTGLSKERGIITSAYIALKPKTGVNSRFYHYLLHTYDTLKVFYNMGNGVRQGLNYDEFAKLMVYSPSDTEQQRIADFLDRECAKIDGLKADIQTQIDTLEQYKRSVITEAVTHGLNPSAPMKDSGINYISEYPIHWSLRRLKYILNERNERSITGTEELLSVSLYKGVIPSSEMTNRTMQADSLIGYKRVHKSDLVFNKLNPGMARFGCSNYDGITSPDFAVYIVNENYCNAKFLQYLLKTDFYVEKIKSVSMGVGDGFTRLYSNQLYEFFVALPPRDEVSIIINYLDNKCAEIEQIIADKKTQIETLDGYKKSLIYEYVTGKKEVV